MLLCALNLLACLHVQEPHAHRALGSVSLARTRLRVDWSWQWVLLRSDSDRLCVLVCAMHPEFARVRPVLVAQSQVAALCRHHPVPLLSQSIS